MVEIISGERGTSQQLQNSVGERQLGLSEEGPVVEKVEVEVVVVVEHLTVAEVAWVDVDYLEDLGLNIN